MIKIKLSHIILPSDSLAILPTDQDVYLKPLYF